MSDLPLIPNPTPKNFGHTTVGQWLYLQTPLAPTDDFTIKSLGYDPSTGFIDHNDAITIQKSFAEIVSGKYPKAAAAVPVILQLIAEAKAEIEAIDAADKAAAEAEQETPE